MTRFRAVTRVAAARISVALLLVACGNIEEQSLCRQWDDLQAASAEVQALDPETATADDVEEVVDRALGELEQFSRAAEGLYDGAVSTLRAELVNLRQASHDAGSLTLEVARPLLEETWADTQTAYQVLAQRLNIVCSG